MEIAFAELSPESLAAAVGGSPISRKPWSRGCSRRAKTFDVLPAVVAAEVGAGRVCDTALGRTAHHARRPPRRCSVSAASGDPVRRAEPPKVTRIAQGPWDAAAAHVADPLAADANAAAAAGDAP